MKQANSKHFFCRQLTCKLSGYRSALGITANKVREETDIDVNKIENNASNLTVYTLYSLLKFYGISMSVFFAELENETVLESEMRRDELLEISE